MKQVPTQKSETPTEEKRKSLRIVDNQTDKQHGVSEELIERDEVENTPFVIITINKESFGTFGKYQITEKYHTKQQCRVELLSMNWNNIIKIMTIVFEIITDHKTNMKVKS